MNGNGSGRTYYLPTCRYSFLPHKNGKLRQRRLLNPEGGVPKQKKVVMGHPVSSF